MSFDAAITTRDELRTIYREPARGAVLKQIDRLDANCAAFIAHAPFVVVATTDESGRCDVSPKGGPPGFVRVLDEHRLAIPDLNGNNRLDSIENLVRSAGIALLFMIPGLDETLRVNGRATVTTAPEVLDACSVVDVRPRVAIGVDVDEAYIHCAKALRRASLWQPEGWPDRSDLPTPACMLRDHSGATGVDPAVIEARLEENYRTTLWQAGGGDPS